VATPTLKAALVGVNVGVQAQSAYTETAIFLSPGQNRTVSQAVGDFWCTGPRGWAPSGKYRDPRFRKRLSS